ncbi:PREDICTED: uncharacterized protein LOC104818986 [Tarenaya hassleriana]|uniref:uncharacterized protein LOC104818986 n=1 Tax=Tarenaya hassleriana TaxID=28532 RepID=UPI00053C3766|nr:PREDICTED: uncharacterized protein LOC104818986 [Tarenaya hassleriana]
MGFTRTKRVTDPLADEVRARFFGCSFSSGSEHSGDGFHDDDSPCLSELVHGFLEDHQDEIAGESSSRWSENDSGSDSESDSERVDSSAERSDAAEEIARLIRNCIRDDPYGHALLVHVTRAMEVLSSNGSHGEHHAVFHPNDTPSPDSQHERRAVLRRRVMSLLRELGHNAAICKTRWRSSGNLPAGNHEFIDIIVQSNNDTYRYIVELDFTSQFEIARPTTQYSFVLQSLPRIFVGRVEDLKRLVRLTCDTARRSLRSRGLTVPPWRKNRYMQTRWLGPYKRTTAGLTPSSDDANTVVCRAIGFDNTIEGRLFVRTR